MEKLELLEPLDREELEKLELELELICTAHFSGACFVLAIKLPDTVVKISDRLPVNG
jgi:hypothetical protein